MEYCNFRGKAGGGPAGGRREAGGTRRAVAERPSGGKHRRSVGSGSKTGQMIILVNTTYYNKELCKLRTPRMTFYHAFYSQGEVGNYLSDGQVPHLNSPTETESE